MNTCINCGSIRFKLTIKNNKGVWECKNPSCMQKFSVDQVKEHNHEV